MSDKIWNDIKNELFNNALIKHTEPMANKIDGVMVIYEEAKECLEAIFNHQGDDNKDYTEKIYHEAIQTCAMCIRYYQDIEKWDIDKAIIYFDDFIVPFRSKYTTLQEATHNLLTAMMRLYSIDDVNFNPIDYTLKITFGILDKIESERSLNVLG